MVAVQMSPRLGDKETNINKALTMIDEAKERGADIVCLPELWSTGYLALGNKFFDLAEPIPGPTIEKLARKAKEHKIYLIAGSIVERVNKTTIRNTSVVLEPKGTILGKYSKMHLWPPERRYFVPGDSYKVFRTAFGNIGIIICMDMNFPEPARILALQGAKIIFAPVAWYAHEDLYDLDSRANAQMNGVFLVAVNRVGEERTEQSGFLHFFGRSRVVNPDGGILTEAPRDTEYILVARLNLDKVLETRRNLRGGYLEYRRPETYTTIISKQRVRRKQS